MILVTGATGFVGSALVRRLAGVGEMDVVAASRRPTLEIPGAARTAYVGNLSAETDWSPALSGAQCVIHTAARVHVMNDTAPDPLSEYRRTNVAGTIALARQAVVAGVRRFIFVSSIKVNGESTERDQAFSADEVPLPTDPYGMSKLEAENALFEIGARSGMEVVVVRPPLVYGPGVRANFRAMMRWIDRGVPLPLGAIDNRRSLVGLDNLVDLLVVCLDHPKAAGQRFLASDDEDLSTTQLLRRMAAALGRDARLVPVPSRLLNFGAALLGKSGVAQRLCGSLQVDISKTKEMLDWIPPVSLDEGLKKTALEYRREARV